MNMPTKQGENRTTVRDDGFLRISSDIFGYQVVRLEKCNILWETHDLGGQSVKEGKKIKTEMLYFS